MTPNIPPSARSTGTPATAALPPAPRSDLRHAIDASKIRRELGWEPKQDHSSGFRKTIEWYLTHEEWWRRILSGDYRLERLGING